MTIPNPRYEWPLQVGTVYRIRPTNFTSIFPSIQITGSGTVNIAGSIQTPASIDDPILTSQPADQNLFGFYAFKLALPNYIRIDENTSGSPVVTIKGFEEPEVIFGG